MDDDDSNFFPKGVTALIIFRALPEIQSFTGLSDYLRVLGEELSGRRKIYRQRRNKVLKYALEKLRKAHLIENGKAPGTYVALADFENYLKFLKHNANGLYERMKFFIAWSINEMAQSIAEEYERLNYFTGISNEANFIHSFSLLALFVDSINKRGLFEKVILPFVLGKFEPHREDKEQLDLLMLLMASMDFTLVDTHLAVHDIIFNFKKQLDWINEEIGKFLGLEGGVYLKNGDYLDFYIAEHEAFLKIVGREEYTRRNIGIIKKDHPRNITWLGTTKPWWVVQFEKNLSERVRSLEKGQYK